MAWFEFHQSLVTHRKLYALAGKLGVSRPTAAGHLAFLWAWALDNAPTGDLSKVDSHVIKLAADWPKKADAFRAALAETGFIDPDGFLHDWWMYAGRLVERREKDAERKRTSRRPNTDSPADGGQTALVPNPTVPNQPNPTQPAQPQVARARDGTAAAGIDEDFARCGRAYDDLTGTLSVTPTIGRQIGDWLDGGPDRPKRAEWFADACQEAALQNAKSLKYVLAILVRWEKDGREDKRPVKPRPGAEPDGSADADAFVENQRKIEARIRAEGVA